MSVAVLLIKQSFNCQILRMDNKEMPENLQYLVCLRFYNSQLTFLKSLPESLYSTSFTFGLGYLAILIKLADDRHSEPCFCTGLAEREDVE